MLSDPKIKRRYLPKNSGFLFIILHLANGPDGRLESKEIITNFNFWRKHVVIKLYGIPQPKGGKS